jgi:4-carboxymuconolactone decarboxylase
VIENRIPLQTSTSTTGDVQNILGKLEGSGRDITIVRLMANWESGFRPFVKMADALLTKGTLAPVMREMCVLHIANQRGFEYEWTEHIPMSAAAGVTEAQRAALRQGDTSDDELFTGDQRVAIAFISELIATGVATPATWDFTVTRLGFNEALELIFVYAWCGFAAVATQVLVPLADK